MKLKETRITKACASNTTFRPAPPLFNNAGVVDKPTICITRAPAKGRIDLKVRAQCVAGLWIAEAEWRAPCPHLPGDGAPLGKSSKRFLSRSQAIDAALDRALFQIAHALAALAKSPRWSSELESLRAWAREILWKERANDEALPLRGMTFIDLLTGAGGLALALVQNGARCTLGCEIEDQARSMFIEHIRPARMEEDLLELDGSGLKADILTMGLVCTAYSKAGKGLGANDPDLRDLYKKARKLLAQIEAGVVIIECAKQLLTLNGGQDARELRELLMSLGYRVQHRTLDASQFGVPQSRERSFIVATRPSNSGLPALGFLFPEGSAHSTVVADLLEPALPGSIATERIEFHREPLPSRAAALTEIGLIDGKDCQGYRVYDSWGHGPTLCASSGGPGRRTGAFYIDGEIRPLSAREAYRLQGFPDWVSHHPVETHALRHAGNAVAVPLARALTQGLGAMLSFAAGLPKPIQASVGAQFGRQA